MKIFLSSSLIIVLLTSCQDVKNLWEKGDFINNDDYSYEKPDGDSASDFMSATYKSPSIDVDATLEAMTVSQKEIARTNLRAAGLITLAEANTIDSLSSNAIDVLEGVRKSRADYDQANYQRDSNDFFTKSSPSAMFRRSYDFAEDTVTWNSNMADEFTISSLSKMPVRNQGSRPTCSSFAGVAQIEAYLIKRYELDGIDLSEQRFYYMSKPEHWADGGSASSGGSNAGTGFSKSNGYSHDGVTYPPDSPTDYNIPLETKCPYNSKLGETDLQTPQASGCKTGVAKVSSFKAWVYDWGNRPTSAQEIYDVLANSDLPVVVSSKLSANWEYNDGMITLAGAGGTGGSSHASGHAYLVVGAKKISESDFPNEGGMCFIIRNSWGRGWGVNGLSCMTLAWFNAWRYDTGFPIADQVDIDTAAIKTETDNLEVMPTELEDPKPTTRTKTRKSIPSRGTASFFTEPSVTALADKTFGSYLDDNNRYSKIMYWTEESTKFYFQGILDGDRQLTHPVELILSDGVLSYVFEKRGTQKVGVVDSTNNIVSLCSQIYSQVCVLNYDSTTNELLIGLTEEESLKEESKGPYSWTSFDLPGDDVEISKPNGINSNVDVRYVVDGENTNPLRFNVSPDDGAINFQKEKVGSVKDLAFCNEDYKSKCRSVKSDDDFHVLFKAGEK